MVNISVMPTIQPIKLVPKYRKAADQLLQLILSGDLQEGDQLPGERVLASRLGVSHMTMRQATGYLVEKGVLRREHGRGTFVQNPEGAKKIRVRTIVAALPWNKPDGVGALLLGGMESQASINGKHVVLVNTQNDPTVLVNRLKDAFSMGIRGVLVWPPDMSTPEMRDALYHLVARDMKIVCVDRYWVEFPSDRVVTDEADAAMQVVKHLKDEGYQTIWYAGGKDMYVSTTARDRLAEIACAAGKLGVQFNNSAPLLSKDDYRDFIKTVISAHGRPHAIVCQHNILTSEIAKIIFSEFDILPPHDIGLVGYDDTCPIPAHLPVPVSMVRQDFEEIGRQAVKLLMERMIDDSEISHQVIEVPARLIVRNSSRRRSQNV